MVSLICQRKCGWEWCVMVFLFSCHFLAVSFSHLYSSSPIFHWLISPLTCVFLLHHSKSQFSLKMQFVRKKDFRVSLPTRQKTDSHYLTSGACSLPSCVCVLYLVPFLLTFVRCGNQHGMCVTNSSILQVSLTVLWKKELLNVGRVKASTHPHNSLPDYVPFCFFWFSFG